KAEIEHLEAERRAAPDARQTLLDIRLDKAVRRLDHLAARPQSELRAPAQRGDSKLKTLERQPDTAGADARQSIERRIAEIRDDRARRERLLEQALEIAQEARA